MHQMLHNNSVEVHYFFEITGIKTYQIFARHDLYLLYYPAVKKWNGYCNRLSRLR